MDSDEQLLPDFIKQMSDQHRQAWVKGIVQRLMQAWRVKDQKALSVFLGLHENTVSNWIQNRTVPWQTIYNCHIATGYSLTWLIDGKHDSDDACCDPTCAMKSRFEATLKSVLTSAADMTLIQNDEAAFETLYRGALAAFDKAWKKHRK